MFIILGYASAKMGQNTNLYNNPQNMINILINIQSGLTFFLLKAYLPRSPKKCSTQKKGRALLGRGSLERLHPTKPFLKELTIHTCSLENETDIKDISVTLLTQHFQVYSIKETNPPT